MDELGFVVTPGEIANRAAAIDRNVQLLDKAINASKVPALNTPWRTEWASFTRRWSVERDSLASWDARLFATRVMPRLDSFEASYEWWAKDYQKRAKVAPAVAAMVEQTGMAEALIPTPVWWVLGAVGLGAAGLVALKLR